MDQWGVLTNVTNVIARDDLDSIKRKNLVRQIKVCLYVDYICPSPSNPTPNIHCYFVQHVNTISI